MTTGNNAFNNSDENRQEDSLPSARTEDTTLRQETMGAVGALGSMGTLGVGLPGSGTYVGGATLFGLTMPFGRGNDSDGRLAESAEVALAEEPRLSTSAATGIHVDTAFGVVELSGDVPTEADREIAEEAVSHLAGVNAVENKLHVAISPSPSLPREQE